MIISRNSGNSSRPLPSKSHASKTFLASAPCRRMKLCSFAMTSLKPSSRVVVVVVVAPPPDEAAAAWACMHSPIAAMRSSYRTNPSCRTSHRTPK